MIGLNIILFIPGSILNAQGEKYWDGMGGNGGVTKPKFFNIATSGGSVFRNIYLLNCAHFCVRVAANDTHLYGWTLDVNAGNLVSLLSQSNIIIL